MRRSPGVLAGPLAALARPGLAGQDPAAAATWDRERREAWRRSARSAVPPLSDEGYVQSFHLVAAR